MKNKQKGKHAKREIPEKTINKKITQNEKMKNKNKRMKSISNHPIHEK